MCHTYKSIYYLYFVFKIRYHTHGIKMECFVNVNSEVLRTGQCRRVWETYVWLVRYIWFTKNGVSDAVRWYLSRWPIKSDSQGIKPLLNGDGDRQIAMVTDQSSSSWKSNHHPLKANGHAHWCCSPKSF